MVDGCVLLCHGRGHANTYLPGGHIEKGEAAAVALKREIREELALPCRVGRFIGAVENQFEQKGRQVDEINLLFEVEIQGVHPCAAVESAEAWLDFRWESVGNLEAAGLEPKVAIELLRAFEAGCDGAGWGSSYEGQV